MQEQILRFLSLPFFFFFFLVPRVDWGRTWEDGKTRVRVRKRVSRQKTDEKKKLKFNAWAARCDGLHCE